MNNNIVRPLLPAAAQDTFKFDQFEIKTFKRSVFKSCGCTFVSGHFIISISSIDLSCFDSGVVCVMDESDC